jgi:hypothetical protein
MMIPLALLVVHFVGDFLLQSTYMATRKATSWTALSWHVSVYSACFALWGLTFVALTWVTHFMTDAVTSRINARLWEFPQRRWFFVAVGADQLIHAATLGWTWRYCIST